MKQGRHALFTLGLCAVAFVLTGCPRHSAGNLPGKWVYVAVDAASLEAPQFRAFLTFGEPGSGGMGTFLYEEELLLPDDGAGTMSWHPSYYADGFYSTAPFGHPDESDIFTYWADTELSVDIREYAPALTQSYDAASDTYTYTLETAPFDGETSRYSHAVFTINAFDQLLISWGNRTVPPTGTLQTDKAFSINEGIAADTYVRVGN
ncbi:MAG TPA: hypothetical protein ENN29_04425 [Candidatus Hydrogenedentes bacterium]|nr:hypothetical protein [Candidatus Hydrogenedentota bacterium]